MGEVEDPAPASDVPVNADPADETPGDEVGLLAPQPLPEPHCAPAGPFQGYVCQYTPLHITLANVGRYRAL